jgi:hypothetical protein
MQQCVFCEVWNYFLNNGHHGIDQTMAAVVSGTTGWMSEQSGFDSLRAQEILSAQ